MGEAPFELGGLSVGNIRMRNLGLLLKWWWKFSYEDNALWKNIVKSVHNILSSKSSFTTFEVVKYGTFSEVNKACKKIQWLHDVTNENLCL